VSLFQIPLVNVPQTFNITLSGVEYTFTCKWNDQGQTWMLDIADAVSNAYLLTGIPLVTGIDLLDGLAYVGIPGSLYVYTPTDPDAVPTLDNLGVDSFLYYETSVSQ
jgi:hypothetical protein